MIDVKTLPFHSLKLNESKDAKRYYIDFKLNDYNYALSFNRIEFKPISVIHIGNGWVKQCSFCENRGPSICKALNEQLESLYDTLKQHPSIRLEFLFLSKT